VEVVKGIEVLEEDRVRGRGRGGGGRGGRVANWERWRGRIGRWPLQAREAPQHFFWLCYLLLLLLPSCFLCFDSSSLFLFVKLQSFLPLMNGERWKKRGKNEEGKEGGLIL
jgi:hypothetical protein